MKGTLHKTESGWEVIHFQSTLNGSLFQSLPLHPDAYSVNGPMKDVVTSWEGQEVEFEIVVNEGEPLGKGEQPYKQYAKLIDKAYVPMKGGEGWDKILDKAIQDKAETFTDGHYHYRGKDSFIEGYKQGLEDKYPKVNIICPRCKALMPCECNPIRQTSLLNSIRANPSWDTIIREFHLANQQILKGAPPLIFECWLVENYNPPTKKQDHE